MKISKEKTISICDKVIEGCFYSLLVVITFSTSLVEISASLMILAWVIKKAVGNDLKALDSVPARLLLALLLWTVLSCFNSSYFSQSFRGVFKIVEYGLMFLIAATEMRKASAARRTLKVIIVMVCVTCINGLVQRHTGVDLIRQRHLIRQDYLLRISSSFVHPNSFGSYLLVVSSVLLSFFMSRNIGLRKRLIFFFLFHLSIISLILTGSRGALMSFAAAFLVLGATKTKKIFAIFMALLLIIFVMFPYTTRERLLSITDLKNGTSWERIMLWKGAVNMIKVHPILGFGVNTYSKHFADYKPAEYPDVRYTHNCYLQMASEIGIVGALIFLLFLITVFVRSSNGLRRMPEGRRKDLARGLFAGLVGFSINCFVDTQLYSVNLAVFFYLLLGFCFAITGHENNR